MVGCIIDLKTVLVNYVLGKGILLVLRPMIISSVWEKLQKEVVTNISRRVVSLASFNSDYSRSFACTGLLIKWHGSRATRTVVLTSANLVRSRANEDELGGNLRVGTPITLGLLSYIVVS